MVLPLLEMLAPEAVYPTCQSRRQRGETLVLWLITIPGASDTECISIRDSRSSEAQAHAVRSTHFEDMSHACSRLIKKKTTLFVSPRFMGQATFPALPVPNSP